ncbi:MAG: GH3 auxin-responsive promoter family protein, partial [Bacteroidota bacterium]
MRRLVNGLVANFLRARRKRIDRIRYDGRRLQENVLQQLLTKAKYTFFGQAHDYADVRTLADFQSHVPLNDYNGIKSYIQRMMMGEASVLWPGKVRYFAKSSGTTEDRSKFLPVSRENILATQIRGSWDTMTTFYDQVPGSQLFRHKSMLVGGTYEHYAPHPNTIIGDISAIMNLSMPPIGQPFAALQGEDFFIKDWEEKIEVLADIGLNTPNMVMMAGVPTWSIAILNRMLERSGKAHMLELWPQFQGFIHGGVNFSPYRKVFHQLFPDGVAFQEIYNSTEGYFAVQDQLDQAGMLLLLDNG